MEDLRFYDFEFNLLHIENKIVSSNWELFYNGIGKAEIHLPIHTDAASVLFDNKYLVAVQGTHQAIVTAKQISSDCVIYGRTPEWILSRRVVPAYSLTEGNAEEIVRGFVSGAFADVDNFILGEAVGLTDIKETEQTRSRTLSETVCELLDKIGAGHKVSFDLKNKCWCFEIIKGEKLPIVISESNRNSYNTEYVSDMQDYFSDGIYDDAETKEAVHITKDEKNGIYRWTALLSSTANDQALSELKKASILDELKTSVRGIEYQKDYRLGDTVYLQIERGNLKRTKERKITGVTIWNENGNSGEMPKFEEVLKWDTE